MQNLYDSIQAIRWRMDDLGESEACTTNFTRKDLIRILLTWEDPGIIRICHWVELRVENLSVFKHRLDCHVYNLDLNGEVPAVINDEWLEQSRLWGQGQEEDEEVPDLLPMAG